MEPLLSSLLEQKATTASRVFSFAPSTQYQPLAALPLAIPLAGFTVLDILAVGAAAWAGAALLNNAAGQRQAINNMTSSLAERLQWTQQQLFVARKELSGALKTVSATVRPGSGAELQTTMQLQQKAKAALSDAWSSLRQQFRYAPAPARRTPAKPITARVTRTPLTAAPMPAMRTSPVVSPTPVVDDVHRLLAEGARQRTLPAPVLSSQPQPANITTTPATPSINPVDQAVLAIQHWALAVRQLQAAASAQRPLFESMVMSAGQQLQQALRDPEVVRVMQAGGDSDNAGSAPATTSGASSAAPPPNGRDPKKDEKLRQRLIEAMMNVAGSWVGDGLEHVTGGAQLSPDRMALGAVIAASLGFALPPGMVGLAKGSLVNGLGSAAETGLRQLSGMDSRDPVAILFSFLFSTGATAGLHGVAQFVRRPSRAIAPPEVPKRASRLFTAAELPFEVVPPRRRRNFNIDTLQARFFSDALRALEHQAPHWSPRHPLLAGGIFERMFKALKLLGIDGYSDAELLKMTTWMNNVREPNNFPPDAIDFKRNRPAMDSGRALEAREIVIHDHHLFFGGGYGVSPASFRLSPGGGEDGFYAYLRPGGGEGGFYAYLSVLLGVVDVNDNLDSLRDSVLQLSDNLFKRGFAENIESKPQDFIEGVFKSLLPRINSNDNVVRSPQLSKAEQEIAKLLANISPAEQEIAKRLANNGDLKILNNKSISPALSKAIKVKLNQIGWLADKRYAERYRALLGRPELEKQDLETFFNHLAWRAKQNIGPLPLESVVAELQITQAYPAYRAELARQNGGTFDPHKIINMVEFYRYYKKAHDEGKLRQR